MLSINQLNILLSVVCLVGGFQVATQYFAHQFNYQPQLGAHFFNIYEPWAILIWANKWYGEYSGIFDLAAGFGILFSSIGLILVLVIKMVLANSSRTNQGLHMARPDGRISRTLSLQDCCQQARIAKVTRATPFMSAAGGTGYGHDEAITSNCHIQTAFAPNRIETCCQPVLFVWSVQFVWLHETDVLPEN
jgi:hypothetical protein